MHKKILKRAPCKYKTGQKINDLQYPGTLGNSQKVKNDSKAKREV